MSVTKGALETSAAGAQSSTSVPGAGASAGASIAIADLLRDLDDDMSDTDLIKLAFEDSKMKDQRKLNLINALSHPSVAEHQRPPPFKPWTTNQSTAKLVQASALCSQAVYRKGTARQCPQLAGYTIRDILWSEPSQDGKDKAVAFFIIRRRDGEAEKETYEQKRATIIVAVRGSASKVDWLVNLNNQQAPCSDLVNLPSLKTEPLAHHGLADCARNLCPLVEQQVQSALWELQDQEIDIVFTGHSAGGAVATLLYSRIVTKESAQPMSSISKPSLSFITFGAPPIFSADILPALDKVVRSGHCPYSKGLTLAFIAQGDPVPRMDAHYAAKLAKVYHQVGGVNCDPVSAVRWFGQYPLILHSLGQMVLLHDSNEFSEAVLLRADLIAHKYLKDRVWGNLFAHKMNQTYLAWTTRIGDGLFNGQRGHPVSKQDGGKDCIVM